MSNTPTAHNSAKAGDFAVKGKIYCRDLPGKSKTGNCSQKYVRIYRNL